MKRTVTIASFGIAHLLILFPLSASAQTPATYFGCVNSSGLIKVVPQGTVCGRNEVPIQWNELGRQGPIGPAGPVGAVGPTGPQGPKGDTGTPADVSLLNSLQQRVTNLENFNKWDRFDITVDCTAGQTVAAALTQAVGYASATIRIIGVCQETVQVNKRFTSLSGVGLNSGLAMPAAGPQSAPLLSINATDVGVSNLALTGGGVGLRINRGLAANVFNVTISGSGFHGVFIDGATASLRRVTVEGALGTGVFAWSGSHVMLSGSTVSNSGESGILLEGSTAMFDQGSKVSGNQEGVSLYNGSSANLNTVEITDNDRAGVSASGGSSVTISQGASISDNKGDGIRMQDTSVLTTFGPGAKIQNNTGFGVSCSPLPAVAQMGESSQWGTVTITGNNGGSAIQVKCP